MRVSVEQALAGRRAPEKMRRLQYSDRATLGVTFSDHLAAPVEQFDQRVGVFLTRAFGRLADKTRRWGAGFAVPCRQRDEFHHVQGHLVDRANAIRSPALQAGGIACNSFSHTA